MKIYKRIAALLLAAIMCLSYIPGHVHAASVEDLSTVNGSVTLDGINDGTVTVAISTHEAVDLYCVVGYWTVKESGDSSYLKLTQIGSDKMAFTGDNIASAETGEVWYVDDGFNTSFVANDRVLYATYSVAADTPAGEYTVTFAPDVDYGILDTDFNGAYEAFTCKITVKGSEPEPPAHTCTPGAESYQQGTNGKHTKIVACAADGCDKNNIYSSTEEDCSGGTATCTAKAQCQHCGAEYGDFGGHAYGTLIAETPAVHTQTELKGAVAAHYQCSVCKKLFTADTKTETTLEALTDEAPEHTVDESQTKETPTKDPTCTEEGSKVTETFCSCGYAFEPTTQKIDVDPDAHTWSDTVSYNWNSDHTLCTAVRECTENAAHKETATTESFETEVIKDATCGAAGQTKYTATFAEAWAGTYSETVDLPGATGQHTYTLDTSKGTDGYAWAEDNSTCTAYGKCSCGKETTATAIITTETTEGNCTTKEVVTYTADFTETWAKDQIKEITGEIKHTGNCAECGVAEVNGKYYPTLQAAVDANENGDKVTLLKNTQENVTIPAQNNIEIDLKNNTIHAETGVALTVTGANIFIHASEGGSIIADDDSAIVIEDFGYVNIWNGITATSPADKPLFKLTDDTSAMCIYAVGGQYSQDPTVCGSTLGHKLTIAKDGDYYTVVLCTHENPTYSNITDTTHDWKCACGAVDTDVPHTYEDGVCDCGEKKAYTITWKIGNEEYTTTDKYGDTITEPTVEVPENYYSYRWTTEIPETMPNDDLTIEGVWTVSVKVLGLEGETLQFTTGGLSWDSTTMVVDAGAYAYLNYRGDNYVEGCTLYLVNTADETEKYEITYASGTTVYPTVTVTENTTFQLTAVPKTYTITFTINGEPYGDPVVVKFGEAITAPDYTAPEGYTFSGWNLPETMPAENITTDAELTVNKYTLTVETAGGDIAIQVPYGESLLETLMGTEGVHEIGDKTRFKDENVNGILVTSGYFYWDGDITVGLGENEDITMPAHDLTVIEVSDFYGWSVMELIEGKTTIYFDEENGRLSGWNYIEEDYDDVEGGAWYYLDPTTGARAEGLTRVPYPTKAINGITYAPDQEAMEYAAANSETFIDATEGWFLFGEDGKFRSDETGMGTYNGAARWIENGHIAWHPGMVKVDSDYYYFTGDVDNGGNILATEAKGATPNDGGTYDIYVTRANHNSLDRKFTIGGIYTFETYGAMCTVSGMCWFVDQSRIRLYGMEGADENRLMCGLGLYNIGSERDPEYIYVRSNGECVKSQSYWVPANDYGIPEGMYEFDDYGHMIIPEVTVKDGIVEENGVLYYYENGKLAYNKGLIKLEDGSVIYVRSNGQLAIGEYYVTNVENYTGTDVKAGDKVIFGTDGKMVAAKNGIVDGYYYENGKIVYNAGVIELDGKYYYVRSNGQVVMGTSYWITNVGESGVVAKKYTFDENGIMQNPEFTKDQITGIQDGYYYVDGQIAYGAGLLQLEDEDGIYFIYVRSNGKLATGIYWPTAKNGINVAGSLNFGTDGICRMGE